MIELQPVFSVEIIVAGAKNGCMQALIWTSLERKKRRSTEGEGGGGEEGADGGYG
jgi:hypothetical protein